MEQIHPRVRSGAIAWGVIVCLTAITVLFTVSDPDSRDGFAERLGQLTPGGVGLIAVLALGALILLLAGLSAIRRLQRRASADRLILDSSDTPLP